MIISSEVEKRLVDAAAAKMAGAVLEFADEPQVQTMTGPEALRLLAKRLLRTDK